MVKAENLIYEYPGFRALDNVSFELRKGSVTALVGPNGAGKTTLMRCLAALASPQSGTIFINGVDMLENPQETHRQIGYLSDFFGLYDNMTVEQNLLFLAHAQKLGDKAADRVGEVIALLGLQPYEDSLAKVLSRGWRQRLGIAMSIIHSPSLLILDEPASGLDPEARLHLSALVRQLSESGITLLVSSHILAELEDYSTDILIMSDGRIVQNKTIGSTETIGGRRMKLRLAADSPATIDIMKGMDSISNIAMEDNTIFFEFVGNEQQQSQLLKTLIMQNVPVSAFDEMKKDLQAEYLNTIRSEKKEL